MKKQDWCKLHYVDAFAGRGKQEIKSASDASATGFFDVGLFFGNNSERADTQDFLVGSAIRALRASAGSSRSFDRFVFIDADEPSCSELRLIVQDDFPEVLSTVNVICGDANRVLTEYINRVDWKRTRALVFLDPYGLEVSWDLIMRLSQTRACDVWYLFPLGGVIRMMTKDGQMPDTWMTRLNLVFGTDKWYNEFYRVSKQTSLFEKESESLFKDASTKHALSSHRESHDRAPQSVPPAWQSSKEASSK